MVEVDEKPEVGEVEAGPEVRDDAPETAGNGRDHGDENDE